jgi:uncharacterized protein YcbK (DUF882 family)
VPSGIEAAPPEYANYIVQMVQDMSPEIKSKFEIISGFRSRERQAEVYPGVTDSHHSYGLAVDTINRPAVIRWIDENGSSMVSVRP